MICGFDIYEVIKSISLISILIVIAIKDIKEYRIPNKLLLLALSIRSIIFLFEIINNKLIYKELKNEIITLIIILVVGVVFNLITHNGMGMGDIKLFMVISLYIENKYIWQVVIYSIFIIGIITISLLIARKKNKKDVVPFAPAILLAVIVTKVSCLY